MRSHSRESRLAQGPNPAGLGRKSFGLPSGRAGESVRWAWRREFCGARASWPSALYAGWLRGTYHL
jgi:hypothetical protein